MDSAHNSQFQTKTTVYPTLHAWVMHFGQSNKTSALYDNWGPLINHLHDEPINHPRDELINHPCDEYRPALQWFDGSINCFAVIPTTLLCSESISASAVLPMTLPCSNQPNRRSNSSSLIQRLDRHDHPILAC